MGRLTHRLKKFRNFSTAPIQPLLAVVFHQIVVALRKAIVRFNTHRNSHTGFARIQIDGVIVIADLRRGEPPDGGVPDVQRQTVKRRRAAILLRDFPQDRQHRSLHSRMQRIEHGALGTGTLPFAIGPLFWPGKRVHGFVTHVIRRGPVLHAVLHLVVRSHIVIRFLAGLDSGEIDIHILHQAAQPQQRHRHFELQVLLFEPLQQRRDPINGCRSAQRIHFAIRRHHGSQILARFDLRRVMGTMIPDERID
ncbi:MAG: hypothetical protein BWY83_00356 [bacterium ADurb.Bin478]|nr:MAG: hypothetical protein BWY83_00356 [bacterium ADurb.Bin478]